MALYVDQPASPQAVTALECVDLQGIASDLAAKGGRTEILRESS
jgi:hypothetical protein